MGGGGGCELLRQRFLSDFLPEGDGFFALSLSTHVLSPCYVPRRHYVARRSLVLQYMYVTHIATKGVEAKESRS